MAHAVRLCPLPAWRRSLSAVRLLGERLRLHDVRDVEAFCNDVLQRALDGASARLHAGLRRQALGDFVSLCWRLSGLEADGRTPRQAWVVQAWIVVESRDPETNELLASFAKRRNVASEPTLERAEARLAGLAPRYLRPEIVRMSPPPACYVPGERRQWIVDLPDELGVRRVRLVTSCLTFSTYASTILTARLADWFREELHDSRYGGDRGRDLSLEKLRDDLERDSLAEEHDEGSTRAGLNVLTRLTIAATGVDPTADQAAWSSYLTPEAA